MSAAAGKYLEDGRDKTVPSATFCSVSVRERFELRKMKGQNTENSTILIFNAFYRTFE